METAMKKNSLLGRSAFIAFGVLLLGLLNEQVLASCITVDETYLANNFDACTDYKNSYEQILLKHPGASPANLMMAVESELEASSLWKDRTPETNELYVFLDAQLNQQAAELLKANAEGKSYRSGAAANFQVNVSPHEPYGVQVGGKPIDNATMNRWILADASKSAMVAAQIYDFQSIDNFLYRVFVKKEDVDSWCNAVTDSGLKWDAFLGHRVGEYFWEQILNDRITQYSYQLPPNWQAILLHPGAAAVVDSQQALSTMATKPIVELGGVAYYGYSVSQSSTSTTKTVDLNTFAASVFIAPSALNAPADIGLALRWNNYLVGVGVNNLAFNDPVLLVGISTK
jgi:hypothetical protein